MLNDADFAYIANLVKTEAGISLQQGKEYLVLSRVEPLAKSLGFATIGDLVRHLQITPDRLRRQHVVESLTTHETSFFRDNEPFEILRDHVIPALVEANKTSKKLSIWCGAASSGQEPYSLCMILREHFPELLTWDLKIVATDVSNNILERARKGLFSHSEISRGLPMELLDKYFTKEGNEWVINKEIRNMVTFSEFNLLHSFDSLPKSDIVLLRNVLIYFDLEVKKEILMKTHGLMNPGGYLFLGTAETTINICEIFQREAFGRTSCYSKLA